MRRWLVVGGLLAALLLPGYAQGGIALFSGDPCTVKSGTVTQANMRLSISAAFVDFSSAGKLTACINRKLTITDSTGTHFLVGYPLAAGTGETYGGENVVDPTFGTPADWSSNGAGWTVASNTATSQGAGSLFPTPYYSKTAGGCYRFILGIIANPAHLALYGSENTVITINSNITGTGTKTFYYTYITGANGGNDLYTNSTTSVVNSESDEQVLSPSTTGVTIASTPGGSSGWGSMTVGFNLNSLTFTYTIQ